MLKHNFLRFVRTITRDRANFAITSSGIVLGLTAVLLAFAFISDERGFDKFHKKADRIFRVNKHHNDPSGDSSKNAETPGQMAAALDADFPEVEVAARVAPWFNDVLVTYEDQNIAVENWVFADSNFFRLFDFEILRGGNRSQVLSQPGQLLLTPSLARTLFGDQNPIGKTIQALNDKYYTVSGIVEEAPRQSHIKYSAIASWASTENGFHDFSFFNNWLGQTLYTYVMLRRPDQIADVNSKLPAFTGKYMPDRTEMYEFYLQPLADIYLKSHDLRYLRGGKYGSAIFLRTFSIIALLILLVASINYINITTARSLQRAREVGIRKVMGASKSQIVRQFLTETMGMTMLAGLLAFTLARLLLPQLNLWFEKDIPIASLYEPQSIGFLACIIIVTGLVSGLFPGLLLSKFKPAIVLRSALKLSPGGRLPRQVLTTLQLTIGVGLIAGTLLLHKQFRYLSNRDLGFDKDQILVIHTPPGIDSSAVPFKLKLDALAGVKSTSICQAAMPDGTFTTTVIPEGNNGEELPVRLFRVDSNYLRTYGIELSAGRFLNRASDVDPGTMVINETFAKQMGWGAMPNNQQANSGIGKHVQFPGSDARYPIVGVVKDFHCSSLHEPVAPMLMYLDARTSNISVRADPQKLATLLPQLRDLWKEFESRHPFDYYFLDEYFAESYLKEQQMVRVISLFAALAIFIACLGLYGLATFSIARRQKEIGIRKVLGASLPGILALLVKNFLKPVFIAMLIATPVVWYFLNGWLDNFTYHVNLSWWIFALAGFAMLAVVLLTVSLQSVRAATANPIHSLRSE